MLHAFNMSSVLNAGAECKPKKSSKLPLAVYQELKERIEAEYTYNKTLLEFYEEYPELEHELNFEQFGISSSHSEITSSAKIDILKDKLFYEKYLKRLETDLNQCRVLDDIYEETRFALKAHFSMLENVKRSEFLKSG